MNSQQKNLLHSRIDHDYQVQAYVYGSNNSKDLDIFLDMSGVCDGHPPETQAEIDVLMALKEKSLLDFKATMSKSSINRKLDLCMIYIGDDGVIQWCEKGNVEQTNNCLYYTFHMHRQNNILHGDNPITMPLQQSVSLKAITNVRALLTYISRTSLRENVKDLLKNGNFIQRTDFILEHVANGKFLSNLNDFNKNLSKTEIAKDLAFHFAQLYALMHGKEIFTKDEACFIYPDISMYIERKENIGLKNLDNFISEVLQELLVKVVFDSSNDSLKFETDTSFYFNKIETKVEEK